jgi:hypothetical protein
METGFLFAIGLILFIAIVGAFVARHSVKSNKA